MITPYPKVGTRHSAAALRIQWFDFATFHRRRESRREAAPAALRRKRRRDQRGLPPLPLRLR
jgi:hypothetical protein